jgi:DNA-directed RNA polymerase specialized sigma subunit
VFDQAREFVSQIPDPNARQEIGRALEQMQQAQAHSSSSFLQKYQAFVTSAANHMTLLAPIIPAITGLLP